MDLKRRQLFFGGAIAGLAAALPGQAHACIPAKDSPFSWAYWRRGFIRVVLTPDLERDCANKLVQAVLERSRAKLDVLLAPGMILLKPAQCLSNTVVAGQTLDRDHALDTLATRGREGGSSYEIHHFRPIIPYTNYLLDVTMRGYDQRLSGHTYGCGIVSSGDWESRMIMKFSVEPFEPGSLVELRIKTIDWIG